jgi:3-isopropylmalate/(R)-2-methylmalate dehydratase small subunit
MTLDSARRQITGRGLPLPGNDIDTDRIIPARFLKAVTFAGLGTHAFEDARKQDPEHPFNLPAYEGASILVTGLNFGCGSSREHAPAALQDWGIRAIVGGSFAEIFFGNCVANGIPCLTATMDEIAGLQKTIGTDPQQLITVDVERQEVRCAGRTIAARIPEGAGKALTSGAWSATGVLLQAGDAIEATARRLPYVSGF